MSDDLPSDQPVVPKILINSEPFLPMMSKPTPSSLSVGGYSLPAASFKMPNHFITFVPPPGVALTSSSGPGSTNLHPALRDALTVRHAVFVDEQKCRADLEVTPLDLLQHDLELK